jgi:transcriptional regulator with XRE-family HTH domain
MPASFGSVLREKRRQSSLSQRELAAKAGVDFSYISKLENDRLPPPSAETIVLISSILGSSSEELLALTGKLRQEVQEAVGNSQAAQEFLQSASLMKLTEAEWREMMSLLHHLRGEES